MAKILYKSWLRGIVIAGAVITAPLVQAAFAAAGEEATKLPDGLYLVLRKATDADRLKPLKNGEELRLDDGKLLEPVPPTKANEPQYIVVTKSEYVPMILNGAPIKNKDQQYKTRLLLQLAPEQIVPLEKFSTTNVGKTVAILVGNRVVTVHKIRQPITGGRLQITRCSDNGCDVLYTELQNDLKNK